MSERDNLLIKLRPHINIGEQKNKSKFEHFQNNTLRQICKFQNELLLSFISFYITSKNKRFDQHDKSDKLKYIDSLFLKDSLFKNTLKGLIIGHFTQEEFEFYASETAEINKRIIQLIKTRFISQTKY